MKRKYEECGRVDIRSSSGITIIDQSSVFCAPGWANQTFYVSPNHDTQHQNSVTVIIQYTFSKPYILFDLKENSLFSRSDQC